MMRRLGLCALALISLVAVAASCERIVDLRPAPDGNYDTVLGDAAHLPGDAQIQLDAGVQLADAITMD